MHLVPHYPQLGYTCPTLLPGIRTARRQRSVCDGGQQWSGPPVWVPVSIAGQSHTVATISRGVSVLRLYKLKQKCLWGIQDYLFRSDVKWHCGGKCQYTMWDSNPQPWVHWSAALRTELAGQLVMVLVYSCTSLQMFKKKSEKQKKPPNFLGSLTFSRYGLVTRNTPSILRLYRPFQENEKSWLPA